MKRTLILILSASCGLCLMAQAQKTQLIPYGDFDNWITREINESRVLGGKTCNVYAIGPEQTIKGNRPYTNLGGSPWATSNVLASPAGIVKTSNAVFPDLHTGHGKCAKLTSLLEHVKVLGIINMDVMVAGSIFTGQMVEPIKSTKNPYSHMELGIPFNERPKALVFDYMLEMPSTNQRIYSSGFGGKKTFPGNDESEAFILLQRRWEDADGNIYAKRVGTGRQRFNKNTPNWVEGYQIPVVYGDATSQPGYKSYMSLIPEDHCYYARNSKGKLVPVHEVGWDERTATPTHIMIMFSAGSGDAYIGTPGLTFWVDNVKLAY